jgi:hypothetical protein
MCELMPLLLLDLKLARRIGAVFEEVSASLPHGCATQNDDHEIVAEFGAHSKASSIST